MKFKVPEDRVRNVASIVITINGGVELTFDQYQLICNAFASDLAEHPVAPTDEQFGEAVYICGGQPTTQAWRSLSEWDWTKALCVEWQRRMFLAPEPKFDPTLGGKLSGYTFTQEQADQIKDYVQMSVPPNSMQNAERCGQPITSKPGMRDGVYGTWVTGYCSKLRPCPTHDSESEAEAFRRGQKSGAK